MQNSDTVRIIIYVKGRVQGVGFRYFTKNTAKEKNITGFVQNMVNGKVKILSQGSRKSIHEFIDLVKIGPPHSFVEDLDIEWLKFENEFDDFTIKL